MNSVIPVEKAQEVFMTFMADVHRERNNIRFLTETDDDELANVYMAGLFTDLVFRPQRYATIYVRESDLSDYVTSHSMGPSEQFEFFRRQGDAWFLGLDPSTATGTLRPVPLTRFYATSSRQRPARARSLYERSLGITPNAKGNAKAVARIVTSFEGYLRLVDGLKERIFTDLLTKQITTLVGLSVDDLTTILTNAVSDYREYHARGQLNRCDEIRTLAYRIGDALRKRGVLLTLDRINAMFDS